MNDIRLLKIDVANVMTYSFISYPKESIHNNSFNYYMIYILFYLHYIYEKIEQQLINGRTKK